MDSPVHDTLQNGGKGRDTNTRPNEHGVVNSEDRRRRAAVWAVHVHLRGIKLLLLYLYMSKYIRALVFLNLLNECFVY